jgi:hypothetical protein
MGRYASPQTQICCLPRMIFMHERQTHDYVKPIELITIFSLMLLLYIVIRIWKGSKENAPL